MRDSPLYSWKAPKKQNSNDSYTLIDHGAIGLNCIGDIRYTFDCAPGWYLSNTLLDSENAALLICDCATVDDNFVMKLLHFTQAYKCTVTWKRGEMHGLCVTLPSRRLADIAMVHNFVVPLTMCEPFFETWDNGILECTCVVSVEPITAQEVA